jgi:uncharacterized phage-like protein YoqJ
MNTSKGERKSKLKKDFQKNLKNLLTNGSTYDIINTQGQVQVPKTERN